MYLGAFSISLNVKNISDSMSFYQKLGFQKFAGSLNEKYLILKNGKTVIGLFENMLESNIITFNPGWDQNGNNIEKFDDIREIQKSLKDNGVNINDELDEKTTGPGSFTLTDPDGNQILIDQHR
ncbi:MAG: VOC family protein [Patescibacteria group bacterium]